MSYEAHWMRVWSLVVAVSLGFALLLWPLGVVAAMTAVPVSISWLLQVTCPPNKVRPADWSPPSHRLIAGRAFLSGGVLIAGRTLADLSLPVAILLVVLAAVSSPPAVGWLDRHSPVGTTSQLDAESAAR